MHNVLVRHSRRAFRFHGDVVRGEQLPHRVIGVDGHVCTAVEQPAEEIRADVVTVLMGDEDPLDFADRVEVDLA